MCGTPEWKLALSTLFYIKSGEWGIYRTLTVSVEQLDIDVCQRRQQEHTEHLPCSRKYIRSSDDEETIPDLKDLTV